MTTEPTPRPREARDSRIFTEGSTFAERAAQRRQWMESRGIDHTQRILLPLGKSDYRQRNLRTGAEEIAGRHHKAGVTGAAAQVHQAAFGQQNDAFSWCFAHFRENHMVHLRFDFFPLAFV